MAALSVHELSGRLGLSTRKVRELMTEDAARGMVTIDRAGRWKLTAGAEATFGHTLRNLTELNTLSPARTSPPERGPYSPEGPQGNLDRLEAPRREGRPRAPRRRRPAGTGSRA
jgi:hypothetical protein